MAASSGNAKHGTGPAPSCRDAGAPSSVRNTASSGLPSGIRPAASPSAAATSAGGVTNGGTKIAITASTTSSPAIASSAAP